MRKLGLLEVNLELISDKSRTGLMFVDKGSLPCIIYFLENKDRSTEIVKEQVRWLICGWDI